MTGAADELFSPRAQHPTPDPRPTYTPLRPPLRTADGSVFIAPEPVPQVPDPEPRVPSPVMTLPDPPAFVGKPIFDTMTVSQAVDVHVENLIARGLAQGTIYSARSICRTLANYFVDTPLRDADVEAYRSYREAMGVSTRGVRLECSTLRGLLKRATQPQAQAA